MANFINVSGVTYSGAEAQEIFSKDIYDIDLRQYGITFMEGVKGKMKIYTGEIGDAYMLYSCPFTPSGAASVAESYIEPAVELRKKMAKEYQEIAWAGDTARTATTKTYLKATDGWEKQLADNTGVTSVSGAVITVDNAIAQVEAVIMKGLEVAGNLEVDTEGYKVFMNHQDVRLLEVALGKLCCDVQINRVFSNYARENGKIFINGYEIVPTMQSKNFILFGPARNLVLGFDTYDSHLEYKLIDMRETTGDNMFRVIAISNIAVGIIMPELFVYSKP